MNNNKNIVLTVLANHCHGEILSVTTKHEIKCLNMSVSHIEHCVWMSFAESHVNLFSGFIIIFRLLHISFHCTIHCIWHVCAAIWCNKE